MFKLIGMLFFFTFVNSPAFAAEYTYCVPVKKIDYNPFREIKDGKELAYLTLLRSYISTDKSEPGLLSGFEFSPDGKTFTGRMASGLRWSDGSIVNVKDLAEGITKTLPFRSLGERVKVAKLVIVDDSTFQINFATEIQNLTGVLREALSTNSRHNRFWPIKHTAEGVLVLGKFPQFQGNGFSVNGHKVGIEGEEKCKSASMSIFFDSLPGKISDYQIRKSPTASAIFLQTNTKSLNLKERKILISLVRDAFAKAPLEFGVTPIDSFFLVGEPGYKPTQNWKTLSSKKDKGTKDLVLGYEHPIFASILKNTDGIRLVQLPTAEKIDGQLLASGIQDGRLVILQDILKWNNVNNMIEKAPRSHSSLLKIAELSASTIPPDNRVLSEFEEIAKDEAALAPVARRHPLAYSKLSMPIILDFNTKGEVTFVGAHP